MDHLNQSITDIKKMKENKIAVIGLGYVGLPLAVEFGKKHSTIGFDINKDRVDEINKGFDSTLEVEEKLLRSVLSSGLFNANSELESIKTCNIFIVTVPTPTDKNNYPVFEPLINASKMIGSILKKNDVVIYESTVYPGATEEICIPAIESKTNLKFNKDFFIGYSPERINPGDKEHTVSKIKKVTSGSNPKIAKFVDNLYKSIITAGTHLASSIKVAEASKIIENSQRDINIAFVNELSKIFNILNIDTNEVLEAAATKWNFMKFQPGLVGGHCIGVDPYYLAHKAKEVGYNPEIILSGRRINDSMGSYVSSLIIKLMIKNNLKINSSDILVLGFTFKENCPDYRNTKVIDIINDLKTYSVNVTVLDPNVDSKKIKFDYDLDVVNELNFTKKFDAIVIAVAHDEFKKYDFDSLKKPNGIIYDVKGSVTKLSDGSL